MWNLGVQRISKSRNLGHVLLFFMRSQINPILRNGQKHQGTMWMQHSCGHWTFWTIVQVPQSLEKYIFLKKKHLFEVTDVDLVFCFIAPYWLGAQTLSLQTLGAAIPATSCRWHNSPDLANSLVLAHFHPLTELTISNPKISSLNFVVCWGEKRTLKIRYCEEVAVPEASKSHPPPPNHLQTFFCHVFPFFF